MLRVKAKDNGIIMTNDKKIFITLHKNQVWYGRQINEDEWELERENVSIIMQKDMYCKSFREVE